MQPAPSTGRERVADALRSHGKPLSAAEVAHATQLHPSTAREHLERMVRSGLATRAVTARGLPGRPRVEYQPADKASGHRDYRLLATLVVEHLSGATKPSAKPAVTIGRRWGRDRARDSRRDPAASTARDLLLEELTQIGFAPTASDAASTGAGPGETTDSTLVLRNCPFRELAEQHPQVVCGLHQGLLDGYLGEVDPHARARLEPFAEPGLCRVRLTTRSATKSPARTR